MGSLPLAPPEKPGLERLRSHGNQNINNRSSVVTNSKKTSKMLHILKNVLKKKYIWDVQGEIPRSPLGMHAEPGYELKIRI